MKRLFYRYAIYKPVEIRSEANTCLTEAVVRDISPKGALLRTNSDAWKSSETRVIVWFPRDALGRAGTVKWSLGRNIGIEFDEESDLPFVNLKKSERIGIIESIFFGTKSRVTRPE